MLEKRYVFPNMDPDVSGAPQKIGVSQQNPHPFRTSLGIDARFPSIHPSISMVLLRASFFGIGPRRAPPLETKGPKDVVQQHGHTAQDSNRLGPKLQDVADLFPMPQEDIRTPVTNVVPG